MIKLFLKAKHWQLFLLMFGIPFILQMVMMGTVFTDMANENHNPGFIPTFQFTEFFIAIMVVFMGAFFSWFWAIAIGLQTLVPESVNMKVNKFKIFFFTPLVYISLLLLFIAATTSGIEPSPFIYILIFPLHLFSMFCLFYCMHFVAKTIKTVELQKEANFGDFVAEFFLLWFYPVGVWIIQPKVNKMLE